MTKEDDLRDVLREERTPHLKYRDREQEKRRRRAAVNAERLLQMEEVEFRKALKEDYD
jgi:hypothetical protein